MTFVQLIQESGHDREDLFGKRVRVDAEHLDTLVKLKHTYFTTKV